MINPYSGGNMGNLGTAAMLCAPPNQVVNMPDGAQCLTPAEQAEWIRWSTDNQARVAAIHKTETVGLAIFAIGVYFLFAGDGWEKLLVVPAAYAGLGISLGNSIT